MTMKRVGFLGMAAAAMALGIGGAMRAFDSELPAFSGAAPVYASVVARRDGLGRRVKPKRHPKHNANREFSQRFSDFRARVEATHSFNEDPRDGKYLHSHARQMRALRRALSARAA
jgi:hypothetical protein